MSLDEAIQIVNDYLFKGYESIYLLDAWMAIRKELGHEVN